MSASGDYLSGVYAIIVEQGLGKARTKILSKQLESKRGTTENSLSSSTTHILVGNNVRLSRVPHLLKIKSLPEGILVLRADWLSSCLVKGEKINHSSYIVHPEPSPHASPTKTPSTSTASSPATSPQKVKHQQQSPVAPSAIQALSKEVDKDNAKPLPDDESEKEERGEVGSPKRTTASGGTSTLTSPKAGMFNVTNRRWKVSPKKTAAWDNLDSDSDYVESETEEEVEKEKDGKDCSADLEMKARKEDVDVQPEEPACDEASSPPKKKRRWICEFSSTEAQTWVNHNKHITDKLEELVTIYKNNGEKWRAMSTGKVIQALKKHPTEITTYEQARALPHVGERLANKIYEIVSSGRLRRLENVDHEKEDVIKMFTNIHGVGQVVAQQFYAQGFRTLDDLRQSGILNRQQVIGLRHYDEFQERMLREEVAEIEAKVKEIAHSVNNGLEVVTCGSYRRGKPTCGDVDILISHPDGRSHRGAFERIMEKGREARFFTDDLSVHSDPVGESKYLGVCQLGEGRKHRRIDIMVVPYSKFPLALLHFTGSGYFNRSMRSKADKLGMSLSEHALCTGVIRKKGVKVFDGTPLPVTCEEDVFRYLDMEYRTPKERDWDS